MRKLSTCWGSESYVTGTLDRSHQRCRPESFMSFGFISRVAHAVIVACVLARTPLLAQSTDSVSARADVHAAARSVTIGGTLLPEASFTVPLGFRHADKYKFAFVGLASSQLRRPVVGCRGRSTCRDLEIEAELSVLRVGRASADLLYAASTVGVERPYGYHGIGYRVSYNVTNRIGVSVGGEGLHYFDVDREGYCSIYCPSNPMKGRTRFATVSAAIPSWGGGATARPVTLTLGAGSGFYGYDGSGDENVWGPIGSLGVALNPRVGLVAEYTGFGITVGASAKPVAWPITMSLHVADFLGNVPGHIRTSCPEMRCKPRLLARGTLAAF